MSLHANARLSPLGRQLLCERIRLEGCAVAEAAFAADHEQAHSVADVLLRRTRLGLLDARRLCEPAADGPRAVARAMAAQLGWDDARVEGELRDWRDVAQAEGLVPEAVRLEAA